MTTTATPTSTDSDHRLRTCGLVGAVASLVGAVCAVVIIAWEPMVAEDRFSYPFDAGWFLPVQVGFEPIFTPLPVELLGRPAGRHAAYLLALIAFAVIVALIASNLAVLRAYRHKTEAMFDVLAMPVPVRTSAHLLAVLPLGALAAALVAARIGQLAAEPYAVGRPNIFELATGPLVVVLLGAVGVLEDRVPVAAGRPSVHPRADDERQRDQRRRVAQQPHRLDPREGSDAAHAGPSLREGPP